MTPNWFKVRSSVCTYILGGRQAPGQTIRHKLARVLPPLHLHMTLRTVIKAPQRTKELTMATATDSSQHVGLVRNLGLFDITMIGVGAMIGAGILF